MLLCRNACLLCFWWRNMELINRHFFTYQYKEKVYRLGQPCLTIAWFMSRFAEYWPKVKFQTCSMHRIQRGVHIRVRLIFLGGNAFFQSSTKLGLKCSPWQPKKVVEPGFVFYAQNAVWYKIRNSESSFFERMVLIFVPTLTYATRKRAIFRGSSPYIAPPPKKNAHNWALLNK